MYRGADPVDSRVSSDRLVGGVNEDDFVELVNTVLSFRSRRLSQGEQRRLG